MNLIFEPGFSTASEVTEVSGRGVGMDVVRTVLDRLKGTVHVTSSKSKGTTIQLRVPLTLASIQTLLFRVGGRLFAVPLSPSSKSAASRIRKFTKWTSVKSFACAIRS